MKTHKLLLLPILFCAVIVAYNCGGCGGAAGAMFVKKWQLESFKSDAMDKQVAALRAQLDNTKDSASKAMLQASLQLQTSMMDAMKKSTLEYKLDGTFEMTVPIMGQTQIIKGTYTLADGGKKVIVSDEGMHHTDTITIIEVTSNKMTVSRMQNGQPVILTYKPAQ